MLVEAANATPYRWKVIKHLDLEKDTFYEWNDSFTKAFKKVENLIRNEKKSQDFYSADKIMAKRCTL